LEFEDADPGLWSDFTSEEQNQASAYAQRTSNTDTTMGNLNQEEFVGYELVELDFNYTTSRLVEGVYTMRNSAASETMMDLSGGDSKSIIGFPGHGLENQQWHFERLGAGWSIRSVHTGSYLTIEKGLGDRFPVVANAYPVAWAAHEEPSEEEDLINIRIFWPNTSYNIELLEGSATPGAKILLRTANRFPEARHQVWRLQRHSKF